MGPNSALEFGDRSSYVLSFTTAASDPGFLAGARPNVRGPAPGRPREP